MIIYRKLVLKLLIEEEKEVLDRPITQEEITNAIDQMKLGKASGPDGFTAKFYKIFKNEITPWIQIVMNNIMEGQISPRTWQEAIISKLPKDQQECPGVKNFRPYLY